MASAPPMQRVMITIPPSLLQEVDGMAVKANSSRSQLIREALEQYLEAHRRQELRELLKEGYLVHAERDLRICEEFATSDYEALAQQDGATIKERQP